MEVISKLLAEGKGGIARDRLKEAGAQNHEPTYRNVIQGQVRGQVSPVARSPRLSEYGKWRGCVGKVHVLIRGDLPDLQPEMVALCGETCKVIGQESAEAIVARKSEGLNSEREGVQ